jgi:hypothetical protein
MKEYDISENELLVAITQPDKVVRGRRGRKIAQKALNRHLIRVVYEEAEDLIIVVTAYRARRERYE